MRRVLNVAEKPSVALAIANILGGNPRKRTGKSKYNPVFEFSLDWRGAGRPFVVTSVTGHLMEVDFPPQYRNWSARDPAALFTAPLVRGVKEEMAPIAAQLESEARGADTLLLWLDCDREGENIAFEVVEVCRRANPRLDIWRARFASIVPREILQAAHNPVRPSQRDAEAVDARIELDLRTGAVWTRFLSLRYRQRHAGLEETVSYGACQFPTLGFVVHRFNQIESFVPEAFWRLVLEMEKDGKAAVFLWERGRVFDREVCAALYERCIAGGVARVTHVATKPKTKPRPFPLTTVRLQQLGTGRLRLSGERIMSIAESLYTRGLISYPRTETDAFAPGTPFPELIREQHADPQWGSYAQRLRFREPKRGKHSDQAHTAIHPTKSGAGLQGPERQVYELIARHFLACCSDDARGSETVARLELGGEEFSLTGLVVHELNYLEVYPYERWSDKDIPAFVQGETLKPKALAMEAGATTAPELLTERDLITLMDRHGIGTDATIASHIQKILERNYVTKQGQHFAPTRLGLTLVNGFDRMGFEFSQPTLRAQTERDMAAIAAGEISKQEALARNVETYRRLYALQQQQVAVLDAEFAKNFQPRPVRFSRRTPGFSTCGKCGGLMDLVADGDAQSLLCPACDEIYLLEPRFPVVVTALPHTCPVCAFQAVEVRGSFGVTVCPACKRNPPPQFFAPDARTDCRDCTNAACALAKGAAGRPVRLCPACRRHSLVLRANKKTGAPFLSCSQYPACSGLVNLPPCAAAALSPERCEACSAKFGVSIQKLQFSFAGPGQAMGGPLAAAHCIAGCSPQYMNPMLAQANPNVRDLFSAGGNANGGSNASNSGNNSRAAAAAAPAAPAASLAGSYQRMKSGFAAKENGGVRCGGCGGAAVELTVKKDNENKGRPFVKCAASPDCGFFKFTDEEERGRGGGGGGGGGGQGTCYTCQQPGHFSSACPNRGGGGVGGRGAAARPAPATAAAKKRVRGKK